MSLTHASFFSGAGGMDIGLERAGWQTVSFSEIEPYACAVLAERWPHVQNLGDIVQLVARTEPVEHRSPHDLLPVDSATSRSSDWRDATLWTAGFPCQDLSSAGQRKGFTGERSVLAFTFLDLVERHRPQAFILENVPGLLSSNAGRDFGRLLREVGDLGYGWAYRLLDAQFFGVPQRRRRVFVLALDLDRHPDPDSAGAVLAVGTRCGRDHPAERTSWAQAAGRVGRGAEIARQAISSKWSKQASGPAGDEHHHLVYGPSSDAGRMRAADGMAGRMDARARVAYVKGKRAQTEQDDETWRSDDVTPTLNGFDVGDTRATTIVADSGIVTSLSSSFGDGGPDAAHAQAGWLIAGRIGDEDELLPVGHDSNRYRAIGNGVAAPVAEWIGRRLADYLHGRGTDLRDVR